MGFRVLGGLGFKASGSALVCLGGSGFLPPRALGLGAWGAGLQGLGIRAAVQGSRV